MLMKFQTEKSKSKKHSHSRVAHTKFWQYFIMKRYAVHRLEIRPPTHLLQHNTLTSLQKSVRRRAFLSRTTLVRVESYDR